MQIVVIKGLIGTASVINNIKKIKHTWYDILFNANSSYICEQESLPEYGK